MKITRVTVTDDRGVDHTWEGITGDLKIRSITKKGQPYQQAVDAHLLLEPQPNVKPEAGVPG